MTATNVSSARKRRGLIISLFVMLVISFGSLFATISAGWTPKLGLDLAGGAEVVLTPANGKITSSQLGVSETIIRNRVAGFGVSGATVDIQGSQVVVQVPGVKNARKLIQLISSTSQLLFRPVECGAPAYVKPGPKEKQYGPLNIPECAAASQLSLQNPTYQVTPDANAANGYIAIAPDLLPGMGPNGGGTSSFASVSDVTQAIRKLAPDEITADLNAVTDYVKKLPSANGKVAVAGFCWGGGESFRFATNRKDLSAAFVFYGTPPVDLAAINAPVYGFYGEMDNRVTSTVVPTTDAMKAAGKKYDPVIYAGAGHGFMRTGEDPTPTNMATPTYGANVKAHDEAWRRWLTLLKENM